MRIRRSISALSAAVVSPFGPASEALAFPSWLIVQYLVDLLLVLVLGKLFERFEVARDSF